MFWRIITHYNERGNVVDLNWHSRILESWVYNNSDPEIGFPGPTGGVERDRIDFESGLLYFTINIRIKVPGEGMVLRETGRVVLDLNSGEILFNSGQNQLMDTEVAAICEAFAP